MKQRLEKFFRKFYDRVFSSYVLELRKATKGCQSLLDVGCGKDSPVQYLDRDLLSVGVDVFAPAIEASKKKGIHNEYYEMNVLDINTRFDSGSFDCVLASDLLEHVTKQDGIELIRKMEDISRNKVIIFTPRGFLPQEEHENNPWQVHKSGWESEEMKERGYEVVGIGGWKKIWEIRWLWNKMENANILVRLIRKSLIGITQIYTKHNPRYAFQIMCVKSKENE